MLSLDEKELFVSQRCLHLPTNLTLHVDQSIALETITLLILNVTLITSTSISLHFRFALSHAWRRMIQEPQVNKTTLEDR
jgi:hypothetical protein